MKLNLPLDQMIKEYESGLTTMQLSEKYNVSFTTINRKLKKAGVQLRESGRGRLNLPLDQMIKEYESGLSTVQLAEKYNVSYATIARRLKKAGVQLRSTQYAREKKK